MRGEELQQRVDPEVGVAGGTLNNAALNAVDRFSFPNLRQVTFSVSSSF